MKLIGKCKKCKRNIVELNNGNVVCGCTDKALDEMLRMWAESKERRTNNERTNREVTEIQRMAKGWRNSAPATPAGGWGDDRSSH